MTTMETTKERLYEAEIYRMAGEIALKSPEPDSSKNPGVFRACAGDCASSSKQSPGNSAQR